MESRKRKKNSQKGNKDESSHTTKRVNKSEIEKKICKWKLDALELEESQIKEDRFSPEERRRLLEAYNEKGFQVFEDTKILHQYLPDRRERDLKGLLLRLRINIHNNAGVDGSKQTSSDESDHIDDWQKLCQKLIGNFAKDKKINLDEIFADALNAEVEERKLETFCQAGETNIEENDDLKPNYPALLKSFAQMLTGKCPDKLNTANSVISMRLFDHINNIASTIDATTSSCLEEGRWLDNYTANRQSLVDSAVKGLEEIDGKIKKCPTPRDMEQNRDIEALCLELPKIKRITDVLNPLHFNESLVSTLMEKL